MPDLTPQEQKDVDSLIAILSREAGRILSEFDCGHGANPFVEYKILEPDRVLVMRIVANCPVCRKVDVDVAAAVVRMTIRHEAELGALGISLSDRFRKFLS